jgi:hypothetical protein
MGRYLDLLRDTPDHGGARCRHSDKSDRSDQNHTKVEIANRTRAWSGVPSLLSLLSQSPPGGLQSAAPNRDSPEASIPQVDHWSDREEERAAIAEHDGGIPRAWAEGFARLDPDRPPGDVQPERWRQFVNDVGRFLDSPLCAAAAALGWRPYDLFGCDRDRPFARIDQAGLLWLLNGNRLMALTENTATIETRTGARQTYRRKPAEPCRALAWELAL